MGTRPGGAHRDEGGPRPRGEGTGHASAQTHPAELHAVGHDRASGD
jgi:hypothetical protein